MYGAIQGYTLICSGKSYGRHLHVINYALFSIKQRMKTNILKFQVFLLILGISSLSVIEVQLGHHVFSSVWWMMLFKTVISLCPISPSYLSLLLAVLSYHGMSVFVGRGLSIALAS